MTKIIVFSHVLVTGDKKFGPAIRTVEIAGALSNKGHAVTIAEKGRIGNDRIKGIDYIPFGPEILGTINKDYDVAIFQIWFNDKDFLDSIKIPIVFDLYAPYMIEHIYYGYDLSKKDSFWRFYDEIYTASLIPLRYGDYFLCASDRQRKFYLGMLAACGRINPYNKQRDMLGIVPYGVRKGKPQGHDNILRKVIPKDKKIILWLSSFYSWLDPLKAVKIIAELNAIRDDYALAIVGAKSPFLHESHYLKRYDEFVKAIKDKDMLGKSVYVFDWIDHEKIPSIYNESDMFILTHFQNLETELSYRVRMTEALWGRLPIICDGGDVVSDSIKEHNLGIVMDGSTPKQAAKLIAKLDEKDKKRFRSNIDSFIKTQTWENIICPLDDFCKNPSVDDSKNRFLPYQLIDERRHTSLLQRKEIDEKEGIIRDLENGYRETNNRLSELLRRHELESTEFNSKIIKFLDEVQSLNKALSDANLTISELSNQNQELNHELAELKNHMLDIKFKNIELNEIITNQRIMIGKYKASIVFGLYRFTSTIGETRIGKILQKILK